MLIRMIHLNVKWVLTCCLLHFTAPSSPLNVTVANKTSTTLLVTWLSPTTPNGVLTNYEVTYTGVSAVNPVPESFFQPLSILVSAFHSSVALPHLVPYSNYTISVRAFTGTGPGEYSVGIEDRTEEDSELTLCIASSYIWQPS